MRFLVCLAHCVVSLAWPAPEIHGSRSLLGRNLDVVAPVPDGSLPLNVRLELQDKSLVKAVITNSGRDDLNVLKTGTLLDSAPVEKVTVFSTHGNIPFDGVRVRLAEDSLNDDAFQLIRAGTSIEVSFDIAEAHDLSEGGTFNVSTNGALSTAADGSKRLTGSVAYASNTLEASIDGLAAAAARISFLNKRVHVQDCKDARLTVTKKALSNCALMASAAANVAATGSAAKVEEYFKSSTSSTRRTVSKVLNRVADECSSLDGGVSDYYCSDPWGFCNGNVLAYTLASQSYTAYCDLYFDRLPALASKCHGQDQASTNLHEMTHLRQVKGTSDYGGYGYKHAQSLSAAQNLNHADTYALFAQSIRFGC